MLTKIFHFIILFAYLNQLSYETFTTSNGQIVQTSETFVEYFLDDVLDLEPVSTSKKTTVVSLDDYRIAPATHQILPVFFFIFGLIFASFLFTKEKSHPFYRSKTICLPGYYRFLARFRPF